MKVIILDYSVPRVAVIKNVLDEVGHNGERLERFLEENGFHCGNCSWMVTENDQCNEAEVFEFRPRAEHVGHFDINTHDYPEEEYEEYPEEEYEENYEEEQSESESDYPYEELEEGEELDEGEEIN